VVGPAESRPDLALSEPERLALADAEAWGTLRGPRIVGFVPTSINGTKVKPGVGHPTEIVRGLRSRGFLRYALHSQGSDQGERFTPTPKAREALAFAATGVAPLVRDSVGRCCARATALACVCAFAWTCPEHGDCHVGTHD
jgi:hypothetical protein